MNGVEAMNRIHQNTNCTYLLYSTVKCSNFGGKWGCLCQSLSNLWWDYKNLTFKVNSKCVVDDNKLFLAKLVSPNECRLLCNRAETLFAIQRGWWKSTLHWLWFIYLFDIMIIHSIVMEGDINWTYNLKNISSRNFLNVLTSFVYFLSFLIICKVKFSPPWSWLISMVNLWLF